jgi:hypothetical protein
MNSWDFCSSNLIFKGKAILLLGLTGPYSPRRLRLPEFLDCWCMKVVRLSALSTSSLYAGIHFCWRLSWLWGRNAAGSIKSMKTPSDAIGNWTHDLACGTVPQPTAPPHTPALCHMHIVINQDGKLSILSVQAVGSLPVSVLWFTSSKSHVRGIIIIDKLFWVLFLELTVHSYESLQESWFSQC